ncbi:hypothetical protein MMF93_21980 [Streptomyces tubbatahanensis]|uniref:Uncharacterized protein n=1 Tax=Streptomyces tubbatahanensis TaxID=2923272 RepID=A0ABY3XWG1_9ACTN|nr:hypothetical protein [Streptomyces tubbatahanensis]UNS98836.1 hypothetical protein MMF93_21980 [Streptomyces tubbatahanensis]
MSSHRHGSAARRTAAAGTIDNPSALDPRMRHLTKQDPTMTSTREITAHSHSDATLVRQNRNRDMQLMPESLARVHIHDRLREADSERRALRLRTARRLQRRAERATLKARRALAMAVMQ